RRSSALPRPRTSAAPGYAAAPGGNISGRDQGAYRGPGVGGQGSGMTASENGLTSCRPPAPDPWPLFFGFRLRRLIALGDLNEGFFAQLLQVFLARVFGALHRRRAGDHLLHLFVF